jgi:hypothetical protein
VFPRREDATPGTVQPRERDRDAARRHAYPVSLKRAMDEHAHWRVPLTIPRATFSGRSHACTAPNCADAAHLAGEGLGAATDERARQCRRGHSASSTSDGGVVLGEGTIASATGGGCASRPCTNSSTCLISRVADARWPCDPCSRRHGGSPQRTGCLRTRVRPAASLQNRVAGSVESRLLAS